MNWPLNRHLIIVPSGGKGVGLFGGHILHTLPASAARCESLSVALSSLEYTDLLGTLVYMASKRRRRITSSGISYSLESERLGMRRASTAIVYLTHGSI
ncbi:hypothetical protein M8818_000163 [Zalaria obscura]|uniref:Uncharacterized protein n=1 Tax=Zalaria obscura TaxID=2024903 RepID=A0ACC3SPL0_9PEZI